MYLLISKQLEERYNIFLWNERKGNTHLTNGWMTELLDDLDNWADKHQWGDLERIAFHTLAKEGQTITNSKTTAYFLQDTLKKEGFTVEIAPLPFNDKSRP